MKWTDSSVKIQEKEINCLWWNTLFNATMWTNTRKWKWMCFVTNQHVVFEGSFIISSQANKWSNLLSRITPHLLTKCEHQHLRHHSPAAPLFPPSLSTHHKINVNKLRHFTALSKHAKQITQRKSPKISSEANCYWGSSNSLWQVLRW